MLLNVTEYDFDDLQACLSQYVMQLSVIENYPEEDEILINQGDGASVINICSNIECFFKSDYVRYSLYDRYFLKFESTYKILKKERKLFLYSSFLGITTIVPIECKDFEQMQKDISDLDYAHTLKFPEENKYLHIYGIKGHRLIGVISDNDCL